MCDIGRVRLYYQHLVGIGRDGGDVRLSDGDATDRQPQIVEPVPGVGLDQLLGCCVKGFSRHGLSDYPFSARATVIPCVAAQRDRSCFLMALAIRSGKRSGVQAKLGMPNSAKCAATRLSKLGAPRSSRANRAIICTPELAMVAARAIISCRL